MRAQHLLLISVLVMAGCQTGRDGLTSSVSPTELSGPAASAIAGDMINLYAEQAGTVTSAPIMLHTDGSGFAIALESALEKRGFTVMTDASAGSGEIIPVELAYWLVDVDGQMLARLSTASMELGRAYRISDSGASPASPLSLMTRP